MRDRYAWEVIIEMCLKEMHLEGVLKKCSQRVWTGIYQAQDVDQQWAFVNMVMILQVS